MSENKPTLGFIGLGVMGRSMAGRLLDAGYAVHVYTRTKETSDTLVGRGAVWQDRPADVAEQAEVIFTIVGFPPDVRQVYLDDDGLLAHIKPGTTVVDMTTSDPALAIEIAERAHAKRCRSLDAPVSGGDVGAKNGKLSIMVGGDRPAFDRVKPLLEIMGTNIVYQGPAGSGQHTKMCNQIAIASVMLGVCEAIRYAEMAGLDPKAVLRSIESGAAGSWSLSNLGPRMIQGDFDPGFYVKHFIKDMGIALDAADRMGLDAKGLRLAKQQYEKLAASGGENDGTQALYKQYRDA